MVGPMGCVVSHRMGLSVDKKYQDTDGGVSEKPSDGAVD